MSTLPSHAADFSQLKSAYTAHLPEELDRRYRKAGPSRDAAQVDWDAHLWSILLSLVKVRGSNWRERWDSVRLAFGLDPNSGDETDQSAATQSTNFSDASSSTQHQDESLLEQRRDARFSARLPPNLTPRPRRTLDPVLPPRDALSLPRASSPPPERNASETPLADFFSSDEERYPASRVPQRRSQQDDPISAIQARLSRLLEPEESLGESSEIRMHLANPSTEPDNAQYAAATRLPIAAKRRFDELVRSSQFERTRLRQSNLAAQEREELERWSQQIELADLLRAKSLLKMCLLWWITLTRQQLEKSQNAADASERVSLVKAWERWRALAQNGVEGQRVGEKTDRVRCALTAFRRWKRLAHIVAERKEELKKESMRTAYYTTTSAVKTRVVKQAFRGWKDRYKIKVADNVRRRHLQAGAFALWQMRSSHTQQLSTREKVLVMKRKHSVLVQAWGRWMDRSDKQHALDAFQHHHDRLLASKALHNWRKATMLSRLALAFAERRLKLAALDGWKRALEQQQLRRKQQALALRWRNRKLKQNALDKWHRQHGKTLRMQEQAVDLGRASEMDRLHSMFHRWRLHSRAALYDRISTADSVQRAFSKWKHRHITLTTDLQQRESSVVRRRRDATTVACFQRWRQLATRSREREAEAQTFRDNSVRNDFFVTWRNKQLHRRLLQEKSAAVSDYFTLRSTFHQWRTQLRERRADVKEASHNKRLAQQVFGIWRARTSKQRHLATLLHHSLVKSDAMLARAFLNQWVARIIEVRSRELEVKEQRQRRLLKTAFYAWIEACLRHDDLLALMNSYIDVKEEDFKKRVFARWLNSARDCKDKREKVEMFAASAERKLLTKALHSWQDKLRERSLAVPEYSMLMRRQELSLQWVLNTWKAQTLLLPAIRMRNTSLKRTALQQWQAKLPDAQMANLASKVIRGRLLQMSWQTWKENFKTKRQLRAAARFGGGSISAQRLRTLSAAAAASRSSATSSPSVANSSSPFRAVPLSGDTPVRRPKTSLALLPPSSDSLGQFGDDGRPTRRSARQEVFPRRSTSVPRHLETSLGGASDAIRTPSHIRQEAESPSKEAASRRLRVAAAATTPTGTSVSERSRFSLALRSSSSATSAAHEPSSRSRDRPDRTPKGPTLSSVALKDTDVCAMDSDTDSHRATRARRSTKYENGSRALSTDEVTTRRAPPLGSCDRR